MWDNSNPLSSNSRPITPSTPLRLPQLQPRSPLSIVRQNRDRRPHNSSRAQRYEMSPPPLQNPSTPPLRGPQEQGRGPLGSPADENYIIPKTPVLGVQTDRFDFEDFRARFDDAMGVHMARDKELVEEYKRVASVSKYLLGIFPLFFIFLALEPDANLDFAVITRHFKHGSRSWDSMTMRTIIIGKRVATCDYLYLSCFTRAHSRCATSRESLITNIQQKEEDADEYCKKGQAAVQNIQNILDSLGSAPFQEHNVYNRQSNTGHSPRPASRNTAPGPRNMQLQQQQLLQQKHFPRTGRFMGSKVPGGNATGNLHN